MDIDRNQKEKILGMLNDALSTQKEATEYNDYLGEMINLSIRESILCVLRTLGFYAEEETDSEGYVVGYTDIRRKL